MLFTTQHMLRHHRRSIITRLFSSIVHTDVAIVGAGHNGLVAAALLAKQGFKVDVFEAADVVGGACRTEYPFAKAPGLGQSTGAYLLGVMPPELLELLDLRLPLVRRDPHYFLPTTSNRYLLFGRDTAATKQQFHSFFSAEDWHADQRMQVVGCASLDAHLQSLTAGRVGPAARGPGPSHAAAPMLPRGNCRALCAPSPAPRVCRPRARQRD